jgi:hypothetical protein
MSESEISQEQMLITQQSLQIMSVQLICDGLDGLRIKYPELTSDFDTLTEIFQERVCIEHTEHFFRDLEHIYMTLYTANKACEAAGDCTHDTRHAAWRDVLAIIHQTPTDALHLQGFA